MSGNIESALLHPSRIIERAQAQLMHVEPVTHVSTADIQDVEAHTSAHLDFVLGEAREALDRYFGHPPAAHVAPASERDPDRVAGDTAQIVLDILVGTMTRAAIFEALEWELLDTAPPIPADIYDSVDYCTANVHPYFDADGEHQFMQSLSGRMDDGLRRYYRRPYAHVYRRRLHEAIIELEYAKGKLGESRPDLVQIFDPWAEDPEKMFAQDVRNVQDQIRRLLRHNAETVMLFTRILPEVVFDGFQTAGIESPTMTVIELQQCFLQAIPTLLISASTRLKRSRAITPESRHRAPLRSDQLLCLVKDGAVHSFQWPVKRLARPSAAGRCPANSHLPALSPQEERTIALARSHDGTPNEHVDDSRSTYMSTAEALLRLAVFVAPEMWRHQLEAHRICPEFSELPLTTIRNKRSFSPTRPKEQSCPT